ncbi:MAG TPA: bifunctional DNA-formamidopyrimidine glycosylase/DNA-(apurinic or apyrimidinic site) lyase [Nevskiaceae bacterium]|nr:bifunctional DNA-formamidopyrimidine glycosylase/DNA-(apurinic or apyrimidinic site) lyase [Nevskiaceae bacterium]
MPELPEVETIKKDLSRLIAGRKILGIETDSAKQVQPSLGEVKKAIVGATIKKIKRRAKLLQIFLSNGKILVVHLKLTGRLLVRKKGTPIDDWQHVTIGLSGSKQLRFADLRKFGWIKLVKNRKELEKLLAEFGPEPMDDLDLTIFKKTLVSTSRPIKIILMDQKKISGVGNIYANEALFLAKINPRRPANKVTDNEAKKLYQAIEKVLKAGIRYRGASDQYYLDALGRKGSYQEHFLVYGREGKKCFGCGSKIKKIKIGGRGTYFCPKCQK